MDEKLTDEEQLEVEKHFGLVYKIINDHYKGYIRLTRTSKEDLFHDGVLGLIKAIKKFDKTKGSFSTYAAWWIRQSISRAITDKYLNIIRWPAFCAYKLLNDNIGYRGGNPLINLAYGERFVISGGGMSEMSESVKTYLQLVQDNGPPLHRTEELREMFNIALHRLSDRMKDIITKRFGLDGNEPMMLEDIGKMYDVSRERIRQLEEDAIMKLARFLCGEPAHLRVAIEAIGKEVSKDTLHQRLLENMEKKSTREKKRIERGDR